MGGEKRRPGQDHDGETGVSQVQSGLARAVEGMALLWVTEAC